MGQSKRRKPITLATKKGKTMQNMDKRVLFNRLLDLVKESDVDFLEVYVGDEEEGQIYVRFENLEEANDNG